MNLIPARFRRLEKATREARAAYFVIDENPRTTTARDTLITSADPGERERALGYLAARESGLYRLHDAAFGFDPWPGDLPGDAATGLAHGVMILRLLGGVEAARAGRGTWQSQRTLTAWGRADLNATDRALADACGPLLDRLVSEHDPVEIAVLYTRLWIAADPVIGGQAAEWIASLRADWMCRAVGVAEGAAS